tara:strand:- start:642 stop:1754 length:1113 start_codon:yes stop_codon:yes gene_type:complete
MSNFFKLKDLNTRMATNEDSHLPAYDHTKLSAVNTCPTWGILRYSHHKKMPGEARAMALEAGSASHEAFAAIRLYQYKYFQAKSETQRDIAKAAGIRLFGNDRYQRICSVLSETATHRTNAINFAIESIESTDFYDDIGDSRRTLSNISESIIAYIDAYDMERYPIWERNPEDPNSDIGIEIPFDIVVSVEWDNAMFPIAIDGNNLTSKTIECRFTGKLDGLHWNKDKLIVIENKTGARLDDSWLAQWILSHQITGYCIAAATFTNISCLHALVSGMRIPIGKVPAEGIRKELVPRSSILFEKWANWFVTSVETEQQWRNNVVDAPMYTHSCNRYFRSCSFLPFCAAESVNEKKQIIEEMDIDEWSPLHD